MGKVCFEVREDFLRGGFFKDDRLIELKQVQFVSEFANSNFQNVFKSMLEYFLIKYKNSNVEQISLCQSDFFDKYNVINLIEKRFEGKINFFESVDCFLLGEYLYGKHNVKNIVGIFFNSRPKVRLVRDGKLIREDEMIYEFDNSYNNTLLDEFTSGNNLVKIARMRGINVKEPTELYTRKYQGIWDEFSVHMAYVLFEIIKLFNPDVIVIGGKIANAKKFFDRGVVSELKKLSDDKLPKIRFEQKNTSLFGASKI